MLKTPSRSNFNGLASGSPFEDNGRYTKLDKKQEARRNGSSRGFFGKRNWKAQRSKGYFALFFIIVVYLLYSTLFHHQYSLPADRRGEGLGVRVLDLRGQSASKEEAARALAAGEATTGGFKSVIITPPLAEAPDPPRDAGQALRIARAKARAASQAAKAANGTGGKKSIWGRTAVLQDVAGGDGGALAAQMSGLQQDLTTEAANRAEAAVSRTGFSGGAAVDGLGFSGGAALGGEKDAAVVRNGFSGGAAADGEMEAGDEKPEKKAQREGPGDEIRDKKAQGNSMGSNLVNRILGRGGTPTKTPATAGNTAGGRKGAGWDDIFTKLDGFTGEEEGDAQDLKQA